MLKLSLWLLLLMSSLAQAAPLRWGLGLGLESRLQKEVNPAFSDLHEMGTLFQQLRWGAWGAELELGQEGRDSNAGGFRVRAQATYVAAWARYSFLEPEHWSPFASVGLGESFDQVTSTFQDQSDVRRGHRLSMGAGFGITNVFWNYLLLEAEVRGAVMQDRREPLASFILRAGVQL